MRKIVPKRNNPKEWAGCSTIDTKTYRALLSVVRAARRFCDPEAFGDSHFFSNNGLQAMINALDRLDGVSRRKK